MGYSDQINYLKEALNSYSAEEDKISQLYKMAIANAEKAHLNASKQLEEQYKRDRNEVYADNARDERNLFTVLAERGLGFSGEAAQTKLNSNITLSNRLGALTDEKNKNALSLEEQLASNKSNLAMEEAAKLKELLENKNQLNAEIAALELEKESGDAKLAAEKANTEAKIAADKANNEAKIAADKANNEAKLAAEKVYNEAKLAAEKEAEAAKLLAEKEMHEAALKAEKEMLEAELQAKYYAETNNDSSNNTSVSGNNKTEKDEQEEEIEGYVPDISEKDLAKQLINTATSGSNYIDSEDQEYLINKYLLELQENYGINSEYYDNLIFMLRIYGYEELSLPEMRAQVISRDSKIYYDNTYNEYYDKYVVAGFSESRARTLARQESLRLQLSYIYSRSKNNTEFKKCCTEAGMTAAQIQTYLNSIAANSTQTSGGSNNTATRLPK